MANKTIPFSELMETVLSQLKSQKYTESTLTVYRRTYNRVHVFLNQHGTDTYTHELGGKFLSDSNVCRSTLVAYACAVRRLDDCLDGKPYRCHHGAPQRQAPPAFSGVLAGYLRKCKDIGNSPSTIAAKERAWVSFLVFLEKAGCSDLSQLAPGMVSRALLTLSNKDCYAHIRQFLKYLADKDITRTDFSGIVPHCRRRKPLPTAYTPDEIRRIESSIDTGTDTGKRNLAIIRLASRMGLRAGDIARLRLSEIDFSTGCLDIIQEKTGIPISLQMPSGVAEALSEHLANDKRLLDDGYVFHSMAAPYGRITTGIIRHALYECFNSAGINTAGKKRGPHALRSSLASSMVNNGTSYDIVRRILGHSSPDVVRYYARADVDSLRMCSIQPPHPSGYFRDFLAGKGVDSHV